MPDEPIFRISPYSPSTSRVTIRHEFAMPLHKFLGAEGLSVEAMLEATGTVLQGYVDSEGVSRIEAEPNIITFVADATPTMLQPLLQRWLDTVEVGSRAAPQEKKDAENRHGNAQQPESSPA